LGRLEKVKMANMAAAGLEEKKERKRARSAKIDRQEELK
jgi:hypothetical protein